MKKSERDAQVKKLQEEAEALRAKIYDLQNNEVEPDPVDFEDCREFLNKISDKIHKACGLFFGLRIFREYKHLGIYLGSDDKCQWKIVKDSVGCWVLIPTVNEIAKPKSTSKKRASTPKVSSVAGVSDFEAEEDDK